MSQNGGEALWCFVHFGSVSEKDVRGTEERGGEALAPGCIPERVGAGNTGLGLKTPWKQWMRARFRRPVGVRGLEEKQRIARDRRRVCCRKNADGSPGWQGVHGGGELMRKGRERFRESNAAACEVQGGER